MKRMIALAMLFVACKPESQPTTVVIAPTASPSASQSATPGTLLATPSTADDACRTDDECGWGEIDHEINSPKDCVCLLGCPSLPQNKATRDRRSAQNMKLCTPGMDGSGHHCPIDDCARPPPMKCVSNKCVAAK